MMMTYHPLIQLFMGPFLIMTVTITDHNMFPRKQLLPHLQIFHDNLTIFLPAATFDVC